MRNVVISILGTKKDNLHGREAGWSPSISLVMHPDDFKVDEYHLIYDQGFEELAETVRERIEDLSVTTKVVLDKIPLQDPWNFDEVCLAFFDYIKRTCFHKDGSNYFIHINTGTNVQRICLFWLVYSNFIKAQLVQTAPTEGFGKTESSNPAGQFRTINLDTSRNKELTGKISKLSLEGVTFLKDGIDTRNSYYNETINELERLSLASSDAILITGPTGAGKTKLARKVYDLKKKHGLVQGDFVSVNCATLDQSTAKSELFGHIKGAFTDARTDRLGLIKTAENGILFLDEIGDLSKEVQTMLLKALEEHIFYPLGSDRPVSCNFQLICGSNQDLNDPTKFRQDLLQRINRWTYRIPGLADRREDIEPNFNFELALFSKNATRGVIITDEARRLFLDYALAETTSWKGNFRELRNIVVRLGTLAKDGRIESTDVEREIKRVQLDSGPRNDNGVSPETPSCTRLPEISEAELITLLKGDYRTRFDAIEIATLRYVLSVCKTCTSAAEAGRKLYNITRTGHSSRNDSDRISKFLKGYGLKFSELNHA